MKVLIDIVHPADVNFFKHAITLLRKNGHTVLLTVMQRGALVEIVNRELGECTPIGYHRGGIRKITAITARVRSLRRYIIANTPDVVSSFSFYPAAACWGKGIRSVIFHDDPEYRVQFALCRLWSTRLIVPEFCRVTGRNIIHYRFLKEWSYMDPSYRKASSGTIKGLSKKSYIIVRDVSKASLNYAHASAMDYEPIITQATAQGYTVVFSLEDKTRKKQCKDCIVLQEPIDDIIGLLVNSAALISSGDTMVREAALAGIPSLYVGDRDMAVNRMLRDAGVLAQHKDVTSFIAQLKKAKHNKSINWHFIDVPQMIVNEVTGCA